MTLDRGSGAKLMGGPRRRTRLLAMAVLSAFLASMLAAAPSVTLAQAPCFTAIEPNDTEQDVAATVDTCIEGALPSGDQDLVVWMLEAEDASTRWSLVLEGVPGTQTLLRLFRVVSEPGQPILADSSPLIELTMEPADDGPVHHEDLILGPGRYLVAIARSGLPGGGEPETTDYRISFLPGDPWPRSADIEPNDDPDAAQMITDDFEVSGDRQGSFSDFYSWTVNEAGRWDVAIAGPHAETIWFDIQDTDGRTIDSANAATEARLYDLELGAGTYRLRVPETGTEPGPYILSAEPSVGDGDAEPNGDTATALPVADGEPVRGRLAKEGDSDRFTLTVPPGESMLRDVRMLWRSGADRTLCLLDDADQRSVCQRASEGLSLPNLLLGPGEHTFDVSGVADPDDPYLMRVDVVGPAATDFEAEPNEDIDTATPIEPELGMTARGGPEDSDHFRLRVDGEPQLWNIDLLGSQIRQAELVGARGVPLASAAISGDGTAATLSDLYLVPGDHWLRVSSTGPEYMVTTTPLGPPDPDGEREPNAEPGRAERYRIGDRRVGRLPDTADLDLYRFSVAAPQHLQVRLTQPADAATTFRLVRGDEQVAELRDLPVGEPISYDAWLPPGDYRIELLAEQASEDFYEVTSQRIDPFQREVDQEPNDAPAWASRIPASLAWAGTAVHPGDEDWYVIPPVTADEPISLSIVGEEMNVRLGHPEEGGFMRDLGLRRQEDGTLVASDLPLRVPLFLSISGGGDYSIRLSGAGMEAMAVAPEPAVTLEWQVPVTEIAAYWPDEQVIDAQLELTNQGSSDLEVALEAVTSHYLWSVAPEIDRVTLPAGGAVDIGVAITAEADAWAHEPVQVAVRAVTPDGGQVSSTMEIAATAEAPPVDSRIGWRIPDALQGGLNAASLALGAEPGGTLDPELERRLFDDVTPDFTSFAGHTDPRTGSGLHIFIRDYMPALPLDLSVDLAGDAPLPVSGIVLNPRAGDVKPDEVPREFELLLSQDGETWESALRDTLSPLAIDQAFVLDAPVMATHAMLRILSAHSDRPVRLALGEWKVIVQPGTPVGSAPLNIADPRAGGHVVIVSPFDAEHSITLSPPAQDGRYNVSSGDSEDLLNDLVLGSEQARAVLDVGDAREVELTMGFQDDRAAQVTSIEWQHPPTTIPAERLERVVVEASTWSPVGPWQSLGTWELGELSQPEPFILESPTWARFVRLRGRAPATADAVELPTGVRILERPTDAEYRSILGEWGDRSRLGPFEWTQDVPPIAWPEGSDAADTRSEAQRLEPGVVSADRVEIDIDEDWYVVPVPEGENRLQLEVDGWPTVGVGVSLYDAAGVELPMRSSIADDGAVRYQAEVEPGRDYGLRIHQPPFSAVFAFDTSTSIEPYLDIIRAGLLSFAGDVQPGHEAVMLQPFEQQPLLPGWEDDPYILQAAVNSHPIVGPEYSSSGEIGLIDASNLLAEREGARAILLLTDGWSTSLDRTSELWETLAKVRPLIFSVQMIPLVLPGESRDHMQDWASGGGHFSEPATFGEMDRAFERMATWLRRPAAYSLSYRTLNVTPATLAITAPSGSGTASDAPALAPGVGVEIILDTSSSMRKKLGGKRRIDIAKASLRSLIGESLAEGVPVAIRTFGGPGKGKIANCATTLTLPLAPLDRAAALKTVKGLKAGKKTATPIAAALEQVGQDLASVNGLRSVVLVTDGKANCGGDPAEAIAALNDAGIDVKLDIIGFALKDEALKEQMGTWASAGGGTYRDADSASELASSIATALSAPFRVYGTDGEAVASGTVSGEGIGLEPGDYRVEVLTDPPVIFDNVELGNGASVMLELPGSDGTAPSEQDE